MSVELVATKSSDSLSLGAFPAVMGRGTTSPVPIDAGTNVARSGFDLPRGGAGSTKAEQRTANIPDGRNDENLAVAEGGLRGCW